MGLSVRIISGWTKRIAARISKEGAIHVVQHPHPPDEGDVNYPIPVSGFLTNNGSSDMRVNGSINNQRFEFNARNDYDLFVRSITIELSGTNLTLGKFANLAALTNGIDIVYHSNRLGDFVLLSNVKNALTLFRDATAGKGFGTTSKAWVADTSGAGNEAYLPDIDLEKRYGTMYGFKLAKNTTDSIYLLVKDDLTGIDGSFNIKLHGFILT